MHRLFSNPRKRRSKTGSKSGLKRGSGKRITREARYTSKSLLQWALKRYPKWNSKMALKTGVKTGGQKWTLDSVLEKGQNGANAETSILPCCGGFVRQCPRKGPKNGAKNCQKTVQKTLKRRSCLVEIDCGQCLINWRPNGAKSGSKIGVKNP